MYDVVYQAVQIAGSLLILAAYVLSLAGRMRQSGYAYLLLNAVGSAVVAATAVIGSQWGVLLLEGVWAVVSCAGLARRLRPSLPRS